jgi:hypothetical protein
VGGSGQDDGDGRAKQARLEVGRRMKRIGQKAKMRRRLADDGTMAWLLKKGFISTVTFSCDAFPMVVVRSKLARRNPLLYRHVATVFFGADLLRDQN